MTSPLDSTTWYRVCNLKPRLRRHIRVHRHNYRGKRWFVLEDPATGRLHRLDPYAYQLVAAMDGQRTLDEVWSMISDRHVDHAPTQDQSIQLLGQLHAADVLHCDVAPDTRELFARHDEQSQSRLRQTFRSPFFVRIPLFDPERLLNATQRHARVLFTPFSLILWLSLVLTGAVLAAMHWEALVADAQTSLLSPMNLLLLWLIYPAVKALHEFGHALAIKHWNAEVHDTGIMMLVFMPVPYVDASTANAFDDKWARIVVSGAGIAVELALAAVAMGVWLAVEPGLVRTIALDIMTIGGVSTLLFNGNPLLKFDGYYVLADYIEIPNLSTRASAYYGYLYRRYLLGLGQTKSPATTAGERNWFLVYGLAAFVYRIIILVAILFFVAGISLTAAVVLGAWAITGQIVIPFVQKMNRLRQDSQLRDKKLRAITVIVTTVLAVSVLLGLPAPDRFIAEGVIWSDEDTRVRAGTDCVVDRVVVEPDTVVEQGAVLIECSDPTLTSQLEIAAAHLSELRARLAMERSRDRARAAIVEDEISLVMARRLETEDTIAQLQIRSPADGVFVLPAAKDLPGRFVAQGDLIGYVVDPQRSNARVAISQQTIGKVRGDTRAVSVRLSDRPGQSYAANIQRVLPGATTALPSAALGTRGGGTLVADPADASGRTLLAPVFLVDLEFLEATPPRYRGSRVYARFEHSPQSLAFQWYHGLRQLLLRRLAI